MKRNIFNKERVRIIVLGLLYIGTIYCAIDISRFHQEVFYEDSVKAHISNPVVSYSLFVIFSAAFFFLLFRKGLDTNIRKAFFLVYATTVSTVLILYKLFNLFMYGISGCLDMNLPVESFVLLNPASLIIYLFLKLIS